MLFIALLQCSVAFSATDATPPVPLYYYKCNPPVVDGTSRPRKNPPHQLTLSVLFDHDNGQLIFEDPQGASCSISCPIAAGAENVSLDTSRLSRGVYVVSYSVNSELIDQKKVRLD